MANLDLNLTEENIEKLRTRIQKLGAEAEKASNDSNDETLSITLLSLARANSGLGQNAAVAKAIARDMKRVYDQLREDEKIRVSELTLRYSESGPVGKSEHQAKIDASKEFKPLIRDAFVLYNEVQLIATRADDLTFRTDTYIRLGQTRVSLLKSDKR